MKSTVSHRKEQTNQKQVPSRTLRQSVCLFGEWIHHTHFFIFPSENYNRTQFTLNKRSQFGFFNCFCLEIIAWWHETEKKSWKPVETCRNSLEPVCMKRNTRLNRIFFPTVKFNQVAHEIWICCLRVAFMLSSSNFWKQNHTQQAKIQI